jgi:hypothetical protein
MSKRKKIARLLVGLGCFILLAGAILHLALGYPLVVATVAASNLNTEFKDAFRAVFLLLGCTWIVIAIVTLIAAFTETKIRKAIVLFCGLALLAQIPIWVRLMGWFIGNEIVVAAGALIACGGLIFLPLSAP